MLESIKNRYTEFILLTYICGFVSWNFYLGHFSFFEFDLLQTRFISAGILILLPVILLASFLSLFTKIKLIEEVPFFMKVILFLVWFSFFNVVLFPFIPQSLGGARPYVVSVVPTHDTTADFPTMGVSLAPVPNGIKGIQTVNGCKIYENNNLLILGFIYEPVVSTTTSGTYVKTQSNRVLTIYKEHIEAMSILPQDFPLIFNKAASSSVTLMTMYTGVCDTVRRAYGI